MKHISTLLLIVTGSIHLASAQPDRWQQHVDYKMEIDFNVENHQFTGTQKLVYTNNSPDTLNKVFYHLYFNAFRPGSMMDVRSRNIEDPDGRVRDRISKLTEAEMGFLEPTSLKQNGTDVNYEVVGTILEVSLNNPILPGTKTNFDMVFEGQVPVQIRRSGRDNAEGISYSMSQWYPKLSEYDYEGWHSNPYVGREFHGVWGDFDVKITIDPTYMVAATGYLQNKNEIGFGYEDEGVKVKKHKQNITWHFNAPNVHDFMWAADPDYIHLKKMGPNNTALHFFYQSDSLTDINWPQLPDLTAKALGFMNEQYGVYPYQKYSVIQGGDGGMEYPMGTLITGRRSLGSLLGVTIHEYFHSWYQMVLGSNESLYPWMDEGFTSYASSYTMAYVFGSTADPLRGNYGGYYSLVKSGREEPMTTHSDHYSTNFAYGRAAYSKGAVTLGQLEYILGKEVFDVAFRRYYNTWKFKHPNPTDFKRVMEKESGLELDWYFEHWVGTTNTIDYSIENVEADGDKTKVSLKKIGVIPMPIEVVVTFSNGETEKYYAPLRVMRGVKEDSDERIVLDDWPWTHPSYEFSINRPKSEIASVEIDPTKRMADIDQTNNKVILIGETK